MAKKKLKNRVMITGSEGNPDYLVIARQNGFILGVRPLLQFGPDASQYGFRLRMQKADQKGNIIELPEAEKEIMLKTFPDIPWSKRSMTRFSTMLMRQETLGWDFHEKVAVKAKTDLVEMLEEVAKKIVPVKLLNQSDAVDFVTEGYDAIIGALKEESGGPSGEPMDEEGDINNVVDFPGGDEPADI